MLEPHKVSAELDFSPDVVIVTYDEPYELPPLAWRWWPRALRWSGYRRVRRGYVLRPLALRELLEHQDTFAALRRRCVFDLAAVVSVLVGPTALYLPRRALREITDAYRRINELGPAEEPQVGKEGEDASALLVMFDAVIRRLERDPFHLSREAALDLTVRQVKARLEEFGEEKLEELKTQIAMQGGQV